jgi:hypothetical protein
MPAALIQEGEYPRRGDPAEEWVKPAALQVVLVKQAQPQAVPLVALVDLEDPQVVSANLAALEAQAGSVGLEASAGSVGLVVRVGPVVLAVLGPVVSMSVRVVWVQALLAPATSRPAR